MESSGERRGRQPLLVLIPISSLLLLAFAVSPYNFSELGSYKEAWPDLAVVWILMAFLLAGLWLLNVRAGHLQHESTIPAVAVLALAAIVAVLGFAGLYMAANVTGYPSEDQHKMLWFSLSAGAFLSGFGILLRDSLKGTALGGLAYYVSASIGSFCVGAAIVLSLLLLTALRGGGVT